MGAAAPGFDRPVGCIGPIQCGPMFQRAGVSATRGGGLGLRLFLAGLPGLEGLGGCGPGSGKAVMRTGWSRPGVGRSGRWPIRALADPGAG